MAIEHREWPVLGWQFHPESILTPSGYFLLDAAFRRMGIESSSSVAERTRELERLWESEAGADIEAQLRQDQQLDCAVTVFGGTWRDVGEPFVPDSTDAAAPCVPLPEAESRGEA